MTMRKISHLLDAGPKTYKQKMDVMMSRASSTNIASVVFPCVMGAFNGASMAGFAVGAGLLALIALADEGKHLRCAKKDMEQLGDTQDISRYYDNASSREEWKKKLYSKMSNHPQKKWVKEFIRPEMDKAYKYSWGKVGAVGVAMAGVAIGQYVMVYAGIAGAIAGVFRQSACKRNAQWLVPGLDDCPLPKLVQPVQSHGYNY